MAVCYYYGVFTATALYVIFFDLSPSEELRSILFFNLSTNTINICKGTSGIYIVIISIRTVLKVMASI